MHAFCYWSKLKSKKNNMSLPLNMLTLSQAVSMSFHVKFRNVSKLNLFSDFISLPSVGQNFVGAFSPRFAFLISSTRKSDDFLRQQLGVFFSHEFHGVFKSCIVFQFWLLDGFWFWQCPWLSLIWFYSGYIKPLWILKMLVSSNFLFHFLYYIFWFLSVQLYFFSFSFYHSSSLMYVTTNPITFSRCSRDFVCRWQQSSLRFMASRVTAALFVFSFTSMTLYILQVVCEERRMLTLDSKDVIHFIASYIFLQTVGLLFSFLLPPHTVQLGDPKRQHLSAELVIHLTALNHTWITRTSSSLHSSASSTVTTRLRIGLPLTFLHQYESNISILSRKWLPLGSL